VAVARHLRGHGFTVDPRPDGRDPTGAGNFQITLDGQGTGVSAVTGLGYEPEQRRSTPVTLRRGVDGNAALWEWARTPEPRTVTITLLDAARHPACRYVLQRARPTKWTRARVRRDLQ
jgi:hypothetical protein